MPMIDVYAQSGTFPDPHQLARDLAKTLMQIEAVPDIPMFRQNTAAFVHELPLGSEKPHRPGHVSLRLVSKIHDPRAASNRG